MDNTARMITLNNTKILLAFIYRKRINKNIGMQTCLITFEKVCEGEILIF